MCKSEIFAETINLVAQETEIPASRILSSDKDTETVDARYLTYRQCGQSGGHVKPANHQRIPVRKSGCSYSDCRLLLQDSERHYHNGL